jgi:fructose/tagatose bisphosphate aldolase
MRAPLIIQVAPVEYEAPGYKDVLWNITFSLSEILHTFLSPFRPCSSLEEILLAEQNGFSSVMIDGSRLPLEENINLTNKVIEIAHPVGVLVEGELGRVGGLEGDESWEDKSKEGDFFTSPEEVGEFISKAPVDMLVWQ